MKQLKLNEIQVEFSFPWFDIFLTFNSNSDIVKNYYALIRDSIRDWLLYSPTIPQYENECSFKS